jgi:parallel beta-helix repeat protein
MVRPSREEANLISSVTRRIPVVVLAVAGFATAPQVASADIVNVHPGQDAIQRAIDNRAQNGDTVRIHDGRYKEDVEVNKRLTLTDAGDGRPVIDGRCEVGRVVDVQRNGVVLDGLKVMGAVDNIAAAEVNFEFIERGTARDLLLRDTCGGGPDQGAGYGVNVYSSERIRVKNVNAKGFSDAGVYIGLIESTGNGQLLVRDNETFGNNMGIIIEEVETDADVLVRDNDTHDNGKGFFVHSSVDTVFRENLISDNAIGIHLDPPSADNQFFDNTLTGNDDDLLDEGLGNCGSGNSPEIFGDC